MRTTLTLEPGAARLLRLESIRRGGRRAVAVGKIIPELAVNHLGDEALPHGERRIRRRQGLASVEALPGERTTPPLQELLN